MRKILCDQRGIFVLTKFGSSAGEGNIQDNIIALNLRNISQILANLKINQSRNESQKLLYEMNDNLEESDIIEECDALLYHSDIRDNIGVMKCAKELKRMINKLALNPEIRIDQRGYAARINSEDESGNELEFVPDSDDEDEEDEKYE
ncbi:MAG: hypothetical protein EZS28_040911 [Streblomastix strix]|uniref:Uncharacterized protein n=1 Tax=Streblomastix strix TaxID=222440 RepID=A0A5J4U0R0_9EUKA|nr:MAG: hypothetical protein EZS28_040911 [Streblomastix strix]